MLLRCLFAVCFFGFVHGMEKSRAPEMPMMKLDNQILYLGPDDRAEVEKILGKKFSLSTVFLGVGFYEKSSNKRGFKTLDTEMVLPKFIPYDLIKYKREGQVFELELANKKELICLTQQFSHVNHETNFEDWVTARMTKMAESPNFSQDAESELLEAGIIEKSEAESDYSGAIYSHGKNWNPDLMKFKKDE